MDPEAIADLSFQIGGEPPRGLLDALSEEEVQRLADTIAQARERRLEELDAGVDRALDLVPGPLRGPVRRILG